MAVAHDRGYPADLAKSRKQGRPWQAAVGCGGAYLSDHVYSIDLRPETLASLTPVIPAEHLLNSGFCVSFVAATFSYNFFVAQTLFAFAVDF